MPHKVTPIRHLAELDQWVGHWVAVKDGKVIAVSETSSGLAYELQKIGQRSHGAVTEYVRESPKNGYFVGGG